MKFELTEKEEAVYMKWVKSHKCEYTRNPTLCGAIGGRLTFSFIPTGLGNLKSVQCLCGDQVTLTDIDNW